MARSELNRALVTGGAGFIGSHLVEKLLDEGIEVSVIDNLATGSAKNLAHVASRITFIEGSINDLGALTQAAEGCDVIFHLAALADIVPSINHPADYLASNVQGTWNVLEVARNADVKRVVYAASSSCYGIPEEIPTPESARVSTRYPYAESKYLGERLVKHWGEVYGLPWMSLRLFNVYGPRARTSGTYGAVLGVFMAQKLAGMPLTVVGNGQQSRDFTHVRDVVGAFFLAATCRESNQVLNVGRGEPVSVNEVARLIGGDVVYIPKRPGEPDVTCADSTRIKGLLGWQPSIGILEGIQELIDDIESFRGSPVWTPDSIREATRQWFVHLENSSEAEQN